MDTTSTTDLGAAPRISYPADLPVSQRREDIQAAIRDHQVVVIAGETGSGKTTQIPKMLLEMGYGAQGRLIGHTQPRRIAARSVAGRIASELGEKLGEGTVGFQVRFTRETSRGARLKLMTDGILLAEIGRDRLLNIGVILGYRRQILPQGPDPKSIIASATIVPERFAEHFAHRPRSGEAVPAPIVEVSGRTYPVEIRYRPLVLDAELMAED